MIATESVAVKIRSKRHQLEILQDIRVIVCHDWRQAEGRAHWAEVARCRDEYEYLNAEIDALTNGRGW